MQDPRFILLHNWLCVFFKVPSITLSSLTGDAGFRKYYRFIHDDKFYIAVDAIPDKSNNIAFVEIQKLLKQQKVNVPEIIVSDLKQGFLCISDFGDELFSDLLTLDNMESAYQQAINVLPFIANAPIPKQYQLPIYDADFVNLECNIFTEWLLDVHLNITLDAQEKIQLKSCFDVLVKNAIEQPQVVMHRDYHSRNLMILNKGKISTIELGVIDFQDAVIGPITYDIVSLLRDCYVKWPADKVETLFHYYCQLIDVEHNYPQIKRDQWLKWFDLTGLQRHVKASGIFARLYHRDSKSGYLKDIPLTLSYIVDISAKYAELTFLHNLVTNKVLPALAEKESSL